MEEKRHEGVVREVKLVLCNFGVLLHGGSDDEEDARINVRGAWLFPFAGRGEVQILDHLLFQSIEEVIVSLPPYSTAQS